ncbi:hypothetical protein DPMN_153291 [Dreissena polymorpha]|uniref:Uncharacterized protein n=1 Tax=Dreissena polymorpha TaxID=45954 RepID=A0A9D4FL99_DREPO|nr:hypothetical protein DPMN_153291 [Dreissena polymorpha]
MHYSDHCPMLLRSMLCDKINHNALLDLTVFFYNLAENFARVLQFNGLDLQFLVRCQCIT